MGDKCTVLFVASCFITSIIATLADELFRYIDFLNKYCTLFACFLSPADVSMHYECFIWITLFILFVLVGWQFMVCCLGRDRKNE